MLRVAETSSGDDPEDRACVLCGTRGSLLHSNMSDRHFGAPGNFSLLECPACAFVWLHPKPEQAQIAEHYDEYYTHGASGETSWLKRMVQVEIPAAAFGYAGASTSAIDRFLAKLLSYFGPTRQLAAHSVMWLPAALRGRLLDVGCGSGAFLAHMQQLGWSVEGVEPDPKAARRASEVLGAAPIHPSLGEDEVPADHFDAVTLSHVTEHLLEPEEIFRSCFRVLRAGGRLTVTTPNAASLGRRCFGRAWLHWDPPRHLQIFTAQTLEDLVERCGFSVRPVSTPSSSAHFVWQMSAQLWSQGQMKGGSVEDATIALKFASVCFLAIEYLLTLAGWRCGEELLLIAEKPASQLAQPR